MGRGHSQNMARIATTIRAAAKAASKATRRRRPVVKNVVVTSTERRVRSAPRTKQSDPLSSAVEALISTFSSPNVLLMTAITLFVALDYQNNPNDNIIIALAKQFGRDSPVGKFLIDNGHKFVGMLMLLPAAYSAPKSQRLASVVATLMTAYLMPTVTYMTYFVLSLSMRIFYGTRNRELRFFFISIAGFLLFLTATSKHSTVNFLQQMAKHKMSSTTTTAVPEVTTQESNEIPT